MKLRPKADSGSEPARRPVAIKPERGKGVFSYYANRTPEPADRGRAGQQMVREKRSLWRHIPTYAAAFALLVSLGYILKLDTHPKISLSTQRGVAIRQPGTYQSAAEALLAHSWFNRNKLTVDTSRVERLMKQQFPELSEVAVTLPLVGHRPVIELVVAQPVLLLASKAGLIVVGSNGKALALGLKTDNPALKDLPVITDNSGLTIESGAPALPLNQVNFIQALTAQLRIEKLQIESIILPSAPNEIDVRLQGLAYLIKFNTSTDVRQQVGSFLATKQKLDSDHIGVGEYIDVRVEEKVFYK